MDCQHLCGLSGDKVSFFLRIHQNISLQTEPPVTSCCNQWRIDIHVASKLTTTVILVNQLCLKNKLQVRVQKQYRKL